MIKKKDIQYFILFLYFISLSAYQLQTGFDEIFKYFTFGLLLISNIIFEKNFSITNIFKWGLIFWTYYFLSIFWANSKTDTLVYVNTAIQVIGLFLILPTIIKSKDDINKVLKLLVVSLLYSSILLIIKTPFAYWGSERIGELIGLNPNALGMRMAIGVVLSVYIIDYNKTKFIEKKHNIFYLICIILFAAISLMSGSRKALIILILGVLMYELLVSKKGIEKIGKICIFGILGCSIFFMIFNNAKLYNVIGIRVEQFVLTLTGQAGDNFKDGSYIERSFYINKAIKLFKEHPIIGYGGNNFATYMREINYGHIAYSHNNFTELLCTLGIIGFIIYYYYWLYIIVNLIKRLNNKRKEKLNISLLILLVILVILDYLNVSYVNLFNLVLLCLASIYVKLPYDNL